MSSIVVLLPDGSEKELPEGATTADLALAVGKRLSKAAVAAQVDGEQVDLDRPLRDGTSVAVITDSTPEGLETIRHSTAHVLAQAVLSLWPDATFAIGPAIQDGFYYDFELQGDGTFSEADLEHIEAKMRDIIDADQPFVRSEVSSDQALEIFANHEYKRAIVEQVTAEPAVAQGDPELVREAGPDGDLSLYSNGDAFVDLCRGPHVPSTGRLGHFKLLKVAGAYWKGDSSRPMLQRIYGTAWATDQDLKAHLVRLEEAAKRDHRKLATELDLVSWPAELGPGLAVWHPKGALVRKLMEDYSRERHQYGGYEFAYTPHIAKSTLWETSGHLDFYAEGMYPPMELDGTSYYPKPMNCPFHVMIYRSSQRSYRDLPLRIFELGTVYRYELSGAVQGLLRSRGFTQDDSHIFTTRESLQDELASLLDFVLSVFRAFGFDEFQAKLSTRPQHKSVGDDEIWTIATDGLRSALETAGLEYEVEEGGGAFYGPKIDVDVKDAIGRSWQLSTIQADFNLPERFGLEYVAANGQRTRPVMLHRALFGSVERFFGVLLEHYVGAFPLWLAPVQVQVLPVAAVHQEYAQRVAAQFASVGMRAEVVAATDGLGKRVRAGKAAKVPYVLVVGDSDERAGTVGVNARGAEVDRGVDVGDLVERLVAEGAEHLA